MSKQFKDLDLKIVSQVLNQLAEQSGYNIGRVKKTVRSIHNNKRAAIRGGTKSGKKPQSEFVFVFVCVCFCLCLFFY